MFGKSFRSTFTKLTSTAKTTANKIVAASKHKGNVVDIPDEFWIGHMNKINVNYEEIARLIKNIEVFVSNVRSMLDNMIATGTSFSKMSIDDDIAENKQNRESYTTYVTKLKEEMLSKYSERLTSEIIPLLKEYEKEMEFLVKLCDERSTYKLERDHYYQKMQKLSSTPGTDQALMKRNTDKQSRSETQLQMMEAPLLLRLQDFENRHDSVLSYAFNVLVSIQKQFFSDMANGMVVYPNSVPVEEAPAVPFILNHGVRTDIDEVKAAIARQKAQEQTQAQTQPKAMAVDSYQPAMTNSYEPQPQEAVPNYYQTPQGVNQPYYQSQEPNQSYYPQNANPYYHPAQPAQPLDPMTYQNMTPEQQQNYYQQMYYQQAYYQNPAQQSVYNYYQPPENQPMNPTEQPQMQSLSEVPGEQPQMQPIPQAPVEQPQMQPLPEVPQMTGVSQMQPIPQVPVEISTEPQVPQEPQEPQEPQPVDIAQV